jgi:hypothetical protein
VRGDTRSDDVQRVQRVEGVHRVAPAPGGDARDGRRARG